MSAASSAGGLPVAQPVSAGGSPKGARVQFETPKHSRKRITLSLLPIETPKHSRIRITLSLLPIVGTIMSLVNEFPIFTKWNKLDATDKDYAAKRIELIDQKNEFKKYGIVSALVSAAAFSVFGLFGAISGGSAFVLGGIFAGIAIYEKVAQTRNEQTKNYLQDGLNAQGAEVKYLY